MKFSFQLFITALVVLSTSALAGNAFDVQATSNSVVVKNLTTDNYMEMSIAIDGCGKKVMMGPGGVVTLPLENGKHQADVKSVTLTPMRELRAKANTNPKPAPQPVTDAKTLASIRPVCLDLQ